jgi:hypothetical protein
MKKTNTLIALKNIISNNILDLVEHYSSSNRANNMGDALEYYIKDAFCGTMIEADFGKKDLEYGNYFSYIGNQNNPPDIIIDNGDAIEVKKIESLGSAIALNSSYPKDKLYADSSMITEECKNCEEWSEKDIVYVVGVSKNNKLKALWFIYGDCYAADQGVYKRMKEVIKQGVNELAGVEFAETNELARVNKVDPLGITNLRVRGMWHIDNPIKVFDYITEVDSDKDFVVNAIMLKDKYESFPDADRKSLEELSGDDLSISNAKIKSPNNPAKFLDIKLIKYTK